MEKVDFKQAKEQGSLWDSQSAMDSGKLRALTNLCERAKELSRDCGSYGDYPASASLLWRSVCSLGLRLSRSNTLRSACEIEAELKADNGGVLLRTLISWSGGLFWDFAKTALVRKRYEFPRYELFRRGASFRGFVRRFAGFCNVLHSDYNAGFSTLLAVA